MSSTVTTSVPAMQQGGDARTAAATPSLLGRVLILGYGLTAYALFLSAFSYAIGFLFGTVVPKGIDDGAVGSARTAILINAGLLGLFAVQHTIMARKGFKAWWTRIIPKAAERSTFVLVTSLILGLMFWQWRPLPSVIWSVEHPVGAAVLQGVSALGWLLVLISTFLIDHFELFGLKQSIQAFLARAPRSAKFVERGPYKVVRHPLMLGFLVAFWATPVMTAGHLLFAGMVTGYVLFGIAVEERDLVREHGEAYLDYRRRVPGLVPFFGRRRAA